MSRRADFLHMGAVHRVHAALANLDDRQLIALNKVDASFPRPAFCGFAAPGAPVIVQPIWPAEALKSWAEQPEREAVDRFLAAIRQRG